MVAVVYASEPADVGTAAGPIPKFERFTVEVDLPIDDESDTIAPTS